MVELKRDNSGHILNGWIPQEKDVRDFQYLQIAGKKIIMPRSDLRNGCSPVENQGRGPFFTAREVQLSGCGKLKQGRGYNRPNRTSI